MSHRLLWYPDKSRFISPGLELIDRSFVPDDKWHIRRISPLQSFSETKSMNAGKSDDENRMAACVYAAGATEMNVCRSPKWFPGASQEQNDSSLYYTQQTDRYNMMSIDQPFDHRSARHLCRGGSTNVSQRSEICMHVWIVADKYLQFISICTVASKGLALGWFIARHDNLEFKSLLRNGPRLISLCLTCPPDTSFVTDSIKLPSRYQLNLGLGLP